MDRIRSIERAELASVDPAYGLHIMQLGHVPEGSQTEPHIEIDRAIELPVIVARRLLCTGAANDGCGAHEVAGYRANALDKSNSGRELPISSRIPQQMQGYQAWREFRLELDTVGKRDLLVRFHYGNGARERSRR